jgi:hypothetical protein
MGERVALPDACRGVGVGRLQTRDDLFFRAVQGPGRLDDGECRELVGGPLVQ